MPRKKELLVLSAFLTTAGLILPGCGDNSVAAHREPIKTSSESPSAKIEDLYPELKALGPPKETTTITKSGISTTIRNFTDFSLNLLAISEIYRFLGDWANNLGKSPSQYEQFIVEGRSLNYVTRPTVENWKSVITVIVPQDTPIPLVRGRSSDQQIAEYPYDTDKEGRKVFFVIRLGQGINTRLFRTTEEETTLSFVKSVCRQTISSVVTDRLEEPDLSKYRLIAEVITNDRLAIAITARLLNIPYVNYLEYIKTQTRRSPRYNYSFSQQPVSEWEYYSIFPWGPVIKKVFHLSRLSKAGNDLFGL